MWSTFFLITFFLLQSTSPFIATLVLARLSLLVGVILAQNSFRWIFFTIVILFVGGIIVLFMYLCSLSARLKTETNNVLYFVFLGVVLLGLGGVRINWSVYETLSGSGLFSLYRLDRWGMMTFLIVYLIVGLVVAIQIARKFEGPLKNKLSDEI